MHRRGHTLGPTVRLLWAIAAGALLALPGSAPAGIILGQHDWETGDHGWLDDSSFVELQRQASGGDPDGWLRARFAGTGQAPGGDAWSATLRTDAAGLFAGGWDPASWVQFDFWSTDLNPTVQVRWQSKNNTYVWAHAVDTGSADGWRTVSASFLDWQDWDTLSPVGASEETYLADLSTIDWIGVYLWRDGTSQQDYGLDDFSLVVPEPAEWLFLGAALTAAAASLRRRAPACVRASNARV